MAQVIRRWVEDQKFLFIMRVMFVPSLGGRELHAAFKANRNPTAKILKGRISKVLPNLVKTCRIAKPLPS